MRASLSKASCRASQRDSMPPLSFSRGCGFLPRRDLNAAAFCSRDSLVCRSPRSQCLGRRGARALTLNRNAAGACGRCIAARQAAFAATHSLTLTHTHTQACTHTRAPLSRCSERILGLIQCAVRVYINTLPLEALHTWRSPIIPTRAAITPASHRAPFRSIYPRFEHSKAAQ